jgi:hypothetical protein
MTDMRSALERIGVFFCCVSQVHANPETDKYPFVAGWKLRTNGAYCALGTATLWLTPSHYFVHIGKNPGSENEQCDCCPIEPST